MIYPEVHLLADKLVLVVSTVYLVVRELIGVISLALHKGAARTYTNEGTQRHEQFTRVAFDAPSGNKPKNLSQSQ
jgi:hypothetical protein